MGVGLFVFLAYQKLVGKLMEVMEASTEAITANTAALQAAIERAQDRHDHAMRMLDAIPGKVAHELANHDHARRMRDAIGRT